MTRKIFSSTALRLLAIFQDFIYIENPNLYKYMALRDRKRDTTS